MTRRASPRLWAMIVKETLQLRRDRLTFAMMFGMPIMQLVLFGFAINADPKGLPTAVLVSEHSAAVAQPRQRHRQHRLFHHHRRSRRPKPRPMNCCSAARCSSSSPFPADLTRKLVRGEKPQIAVEADATDPATTGPAIGAVNQAVTQTLARELSGPLASQSTGRTAAVEVVLHRRYNPEGITRYNIVPGLLGIILTMTMVMMTALAVTRERERGTMENLLAMPVRPIEVMAGKIAPYILIGARAGGGRAARRRELLFGVPFAGSYAAVRRGDAALHHRQPRHRLCLLHHRAEPAAGDADVVLLPHAVDPAVGLCLPVPRHAGLGAGHRRGDPRHAFPAHRAWPDAQGARPRRSWRTNWRSSAFMLVVVAAVAISRYRVTLD